jgi:enoyl-CoA hydratase/carnithine racemase
MNFAAEATSKAVLIRGSPSMAKDGLSDTVTLRLGAPHIAVVTINRPAARNAVDSTVTEGLGRAAESAEADPNIWVVVLTGAGGKAFCAGADLKEIAAGRAHTLRTHRGGFAGFVRFEREKPWIAGVEGFALAGGCEIALACDLVVASRDSVFGLPEAARGLLAAAGGLHRLTRALPRNLAFELIATGAQLTAERAYELGMVNRLSASGGALDAALELGELICRNSPIAVREALRIARMSATLDEAAIWQATAEAQARLSQTADYREGPQAFVEKRPPRWSGR